MRGLKLADRDLRTGADLWRHDDVHAAGGRSGRVPCGATVRGAAGAAAPGPDHRFSRTARERTEVCDPATITWVARAPVYYLRLVGGLYLAEVAPVLLAFAPRGLWRRLGRRLDAPDTVTALLFDSEGPPPAAAAPG